MQNSNHAEIVSLIARHQTRLRGLVRCLIDSLLSEQVGKESLAALVDADEAGVPLQLIGDLYGLANPVTLPAGATIRAVAHFDNSSGNTANPDPNRTVRWGPQTSDGMNSLEEAKAIGNILRRR